MIKVKDGYAKLIGTTYSGSVSRVLLSNGGDHVLGNSSSNIPLNNGTVNTNLNADMLDGLHIHAGRNNEANKIVRTDANGFIQAGWINTTSGDIGTGAINRIYCSDDGYIRYKTPANFFSTLANDGNQISITVGSQNRKLTVNYASFTKTLDKVFLPSSTSNAANTAWCKFARITFNNSAWSVASGYIFFGGCENPDNRAILVYHFRSGNTATTLSTANLYWLIKSYSNATVIAVKAADNVYDLYTNNSGTYMSPCIYHMSAFSNRFTWSIGNWTTTKPTAAYTSRDIGIVNYANSAGNADTVDGLHLYTRNLGINGSSWTFASTANANATTHIYAATSAGTSGQILKSTGGIPTWMNQNDLTAGKVTCTVGTADVFRPIVLTNESNQLYYNTKIKGNYSTGKIQLSGIEIEDTAGNTPLIRFGSANKNSILWKVYSNDTTYANQGVYGFDMTYFGTGSGNANRLVLHADNQNSATKVEAMSITQDGVVTFSKTISGSINGNADTVDGIHASKFPYINNGTWRVYGNAAAVALADNTAGLSAWAFGETRNPGRTYLGILKPSEATCGISAHGTIVVFGQGDTHLGIASNYGSANLQVFGGNVDKIVWRKKVAFTSDIPTKSSWNYDDVYSKLGHTHNYLPLSGGSLSGTLRIDCPTSQANNYNEGIRCNLGGANNWASVVLGGANGSTSGSGSGIYSLLVNSNLFRIRQNSTDVISINTSNNVGISTNSPSYKLHTVGDIYSSTYIRAASGFVKGGSSNSYVLLGGGSHKALNDFSMAHSHPYLQLAGGTMTGVIKSTYTNGSWIGGVTNAILKGEYTGYGAILSMPVKDGRVSLSSYPANDNNIYFGYATTAQINAGTNSFNKQMFWDAANNNLHAGVFTGYLSGNASTASKWATARTLTIGNTGKTVDGSGNVSWTLAEIGAATSGHTHTLSLASDTGTSSITLAHGGKYKLTAGGNSVIFTLPTDNNTNPTNYYWANIKVSATSNVGTTPQFGKVKINTTSSTYQLNVGGDSYVTGWSRAASGFYCHDTGVHFTHNGTKGQIAITSNNEFCWGANNNTLYFNYAAPSQGTTVTKYVWNAGSSSTYASHTTGDIILGNASYQIKRVGNISYFYEGRDTAIVRQTNYTGIDKNSYHVLISGKTYQGSWDIGTYKENLFFTYVSDTVFNNANPAYVPQHVHFTSDACINATHFYESSDIRYKKILRNLSINFNTIATLPLFDFEWIENNAIGTGTSAQAVQQILPNLVSGTDRLTLDYGVLGTIAGVTACKELVTQKSELQQLKEKVKELEDKLRKYENI